MSALDVFIRLIGQDKFSQAARSAQQALMGVQRDATKTSQGVNQLHKQIAASTFQQWGREMTSVARSGIDAYIDFEGQMANVGAILGKGGDELKGYSEDVRKMAANTVFNANEIAQSYYLIASAGIHNRDVMKDLSDTTLKLALATGTDATQATESMISTLNSFRMDMSEANAVADIFTATIKNTQATMPKIATSMKYVGATAASLGYDVADVSESLGLLYSGGFEASQAGTMMRQAFTRMLKPSAEARDVMNKLGISFVDAQGQIKKMPVLMQELNAATANMTDAQRGAAIVTLFGQRAQAGMTYLMGVQRQEWEDLGAKIRETGGLQAAYAIQSESDAAKMKIFESKILELKIAMGEALFPVITPLINVLNKLMDAYSRLPGPIKQLIPILILVTGAFFLVTGSILAFNVAMAATGGIMGGVMVPLLAAVVIGYLLYKAYQAGYLDVFGEALLKLGKAFKFVGKIIVDAFLQPAKTLGYVIAGLVLLFGYAALGVYKFARAFPGLLVQFAQLISSGNNWKELGMGIVEGLKILGAGFVKLGEAIGKALKWLVTIWAKANDLREALGPITDAVHHLEKAFHGSGLASAIEYTINVLKQFLNPIKTVKLYIESLYAILKKTYDMMMNVKDVGGSIGGGFKSIGKAMGFKGGGMVPGPVNAPLPAIVHGGEMVLTRDQQKALFGATGAQKGDTYITVQGPITASDFFEELDRHLDERERRRLAAR